MAHRPGTGCSVRQSSQDPSRWFLRFDPAKPGGGGGASLILDPTTGLASIDGIHRNVLLPRRSTGALVADGLQQIGLLRPRMLEAYNVERTTQTALRAGGNGQGTLIGNLLQDVVQALGGSIIHWEPIADGTYFHLRVHVDYP